MPDDIKKLFVYNNNVIHYRYYRGMYQVRFHRNGYKIEVASKDFDVMKSKFFAALLEQTEHKPSVMPLMKDFLVQWLAEKKPTLKEGTYKSYDNLINAEIIPNFGEKHIDRITRNEIQDYLFRVVEQGKNRTAQKVKQLLGAVFALAVEDYEFKNPMTKITLPHYEVKKGSPLTKEEEKKLIEFCKTNTSLKGIHGLLVLLYTGMRVGERNTMQLETVNGYTYISCETEKIRHGYAAVVHRRQEALPHPLRPPYGCFLHRARRRLLRRRDAAGDTLRVASLVLSHPPAPCVPCRYHLARRSFEKSAEEGKINPH